MNPLTLPSHPRIVHPRTGMPLRAIALHPRTGVPVWPIMGGDGSDGDANDWAKVFEGKTPEQVKSELDAAVKKSTAPAPSGGDNSWTKLFEGQKPEDVKEKLDNSRRWEDRAKDNKEKATALDSLMEFLSNGGPKPTLEEVQGTLTQTQREAKDTKIENAILRAANQQKLDGALLTDSRSFMAKASSLDPSADDFTTKLTEAIDAETKDNDRYQLVTDGARRPAPVRQQGQQSEGTKSGDVASGRDAYQQRHGAKQQQNA